MIAELVDALLAGQNADGGWGSRPGLSTGTEATAFAVLALAAVDRPVTAGNVERGLHWLRAHQHQDGSWPPVRGVPVASWMTSPATLALAVLAEGSPEAVRGAGWLLRQEPRRLGWMAALLHRFAPQAMSVRVNPHLKGWSWAPETAGFVEPTAYALLALKKTRPHLPRAAIDARIDEAERMIYDRMCTGGGWNYGNTVVLGGELWPYADVTGLTLVALQDRWVQDQNRQSLASLRRMIATVDSGLALAWAKLSFALYGHEEPQLARRLGHAWRTTAFLRQQKTIALALLALSGGAELLRV